VKTDPTFWLLARASGLAAYVLITSSVLAGLVLKSKPFGRAVKAASVTDVHRFLALLGLGMLVLHGVSLTPRPHLAPLARRTRHSRRLAVPTVSGRARRAGL